MGYTHYWYRVREIQPEIFRNIVNDFKRIIPSLKQLDVKLAGWDGTGEPELTDDLVAFNGAKNCGHPHVPLSIPWPVEHPKPGVAPNGLDAKVGVWFAGDLLCQRACDGDCSYETFYFPRVEDEKNSIRFGKYVFNSCKTAFRPYDLAVTAFLLIAKYHLGDDILISSDGNIECWRDAINIVRGELGYEVNFDLDEERRKIKKLEEIRRREQEEQEERERRSFKAKLRLYGVPEDSKAQIALIRKIIKGLCPTLHVRNDRGTAWGWVKISGSGEWGEFNEHEREVLESLGLRPGWNSCGIPPEDRMFWLVKWMQLGLHLRKS